MIWSWVLTLVGVVGFMLAGRKVWWAWYVNIANQALWLTYAWVTHQWGFIAGTFIYTWVFVQNAIAWTREHRQRQVVPHSLGHHQWIDGVYQGDQP